MRTHPSALVKPLTALRGQSARAFLPAALSPALEPGISQNGPMSSQVHHVGELVVGQELVPGPRKIVSLDLHRHVADGQARQDRVRIGRQGHPLQLERPDHVLHADELVEVRQALGRQTPGHQPAALGGEGLDLVRRGGQGLEVLRRGTEHDDLVLAVAHGRQHVRGRVELQTRIGQHLRRRGLRVHRHGRALLDQRVLDAIPPACCRTAAGPPGRWRASRPPPALAHGSISPVA